MEMDVIMPSPVFDFNFDSACTSPYMSTPSSPQRFGNIFFSAPSSPTHASAFSYDEFNNFTATNNNIPFTIPFNWEEKPGIPKTEGTNKTQFDQVTDTDFAFNFTGQFDRTSLSADELFDGGKIKPLPLKPPPRLQYSESKLSDYPKSPISPKKIFTEALSPRQKKKDFDPFQAAVQQTSRKTSQEQERDRPTRETTCNSQRNASAVHKKTRSLSPFRVSDILLEPENNQHNMKNSNSSSSLSSSSSTLTPSSWSRKWNLKDLLLFRSASEGRPIINKETLKKGRHEYEDVKNSSFRSTDSSGSVSSMRRRARVSAHELHYTVNRTVSEEMKRKTFLPYRQGLLGCLGFNSGVHKIVKGFDSLIRE